MAIAYEPLYFCDVSCNIVFISDFTYFDPFYFSSWWAQRFVYFYFFKDPALSFIDLSYCLFSLYFFISVLIFVISFFIPALCFVYSFSSSLRSKVSFCFIIWDFSCFLMCRHLWLWTSLFKLFLDTSHKFWCITFLF